MFATEQIDEVVSTPHHVCPLVRAVARDTAGTIYPTGPRWPWDGYKDKRAYLLFRYKPAGGTAATEWAGEPNERVD